MSGLATRAALLYLAAGAVAVLAVVAALRGAGPLPSLAAGVVVGGLILAAQRTGSES